MNSCVDLKRENVTVGGRTEMGCCMVPPSVVGLDKQCECSMCMCLWWCSSPGNCFACIWRRAPNCPNQQVNVLLLL